MKLSQFLYVLFLICVVQAQSDFLQSVLDSYRKAFDIPRGATTDVETLKKEYDFIIIGAGSGGCVVANRLTENIDWSVLLVEAGKEEILITDIPLLVSYVLGTDYNWGYKTQAQSSACLSMWKGRCNWPRGKAMGGTSVINYMVYTRGFQADYDLWKALGNDGWGYEDVLPYFLKSENIDVRSLNKSAFHGQGGFLNIERPKWRTPLARAFLEAGRTHGYTVGDTEELTPQGFSYVLTTTKNGARLSASKAFLRPIRKRKNLHISKKTMATKILIDQKTKRAFGVELMKNRKKYVIRARKEIILSAGALNSPQLLMLSGIGPAEHLHELGIPVIQDLKVGHNLQDHISMAGLAFLINDSVSIVEERFRRPRYILDYWLNGDGPYTLPGGAEALGFYTTKHNSDFQHPDIELVFGPGAFTGDTGGSIRMSFAINETFYDQVYRPFQGHDAFNVVPILMRPRSRGIVKLRSKNPFHWPLFYHNYYTDKRDLDAMVEGIRQAVKIGTGKSFSRFNSRLNIRPFPGCEHLQMASDDYWACCAQHLTTNLHHQSGTCKMGPPGDAEAVVSPRLKVYGISSLRVVDASIIPVIPAAHTNAVVFMIGEKAADMIKQEWTNHNRYS